MILGKKLVVSGCGIDGGVSYKGGKKGGCGGNTITNTIINSVGLSADDDNGDGVGCGVVWVLAEDSCIVGTISFHLISLFSFHFILHGTRGE